MGSKLASVQSTSLEVILDVITLGVVTLGVITLGVITITLGVVWLLLMEGAACWPGLGGAHDGPPVVTHGLRQGAAAIGVEHLGGSARGGVGAGRVRSRGTGEASVQVCVWSGRDAK
jgi:hypothetical protein